jgi:hypothetical protein
MLALIVLTFLHISCPMLHVAFPTSTHISTHISSELSART